MSSKFSDLLRADAIDMEHIDYDDILQLYKGWKKSENELKEKTKQLQSVNDKVKSLQESHFEFRSQIQALESVKELTLTLQNEVHGLKADNQQLVMENKELMDLNAQAEAILRQKLQSESQQAKELQDCRRELELIRGKYDQLLKSHQEVDVVAADEQTARLTIEKKLEMANRTIDSMKEDNRVLRNKYEVTSSRLIQCDKELAHASEQLGILSREIANIQTDSDKLLASEAEVGILKSDIARLVHLLEFYPPLKGFMKRWYDSEGMTFMGLSDDALQDDLEGNQSAINYLSGLYSSLPADGRVGNQAEEDVDYEDEEEDIENKIMNINNYITPTEYEHSKRVHNNDPFPIVAAEDEPSNWVPRKVAEIGMQFLTKNLPHAPPSMLMEFMRKMNKAWTRRENRKIKRVKEVYEKRIADLKRQLMNARPYRGVMAEKQIRRLKAQVNDSRKKVLNAHGKLPENEAPDYADEDYFDVRDLDSLPPHRRRPCIVQAMSAAASGGTGTSKAKIEKATTKKLLEASLLSLETLGRQISRGGNLSMSYDASVTGILDAYPSDAYLRGALWLGKNISLLIEELADSMDNYRAKHLAEIASASHDTDPRRVCHALTLLAASGTNDLVSMGQAARSRARDVLQEAASITPGDSLALQDLLTRLPIESTLGSASQRLRGSTLTSSRGRTPIKQPIRATR